MNFSEYFTGLTEEQIEVLDHDIRIPSMMGDATAVFDCGVSVCEIDFSRTRSHPGRNFDESRAVLIDITVNGQTLRFAGYTDNSSTTDWSLSDADEINVGDYEEV